MSESAVAWHRIKSFVRREGRLTAGQARAMNELWPRFGIDFQESLLDFNQLFSNDNPVVLEIGFGNGESLAQMAGNEPDKNFIGIEVHRPGVGHLLQKIEEQELVNLRLSQHDAVEVLEHQIPQESLAGVQVFFPDPWHKKRHHKRRIIQPKFVESLTARMQVGAFLHCATDWEPYAEQMRDVLEAANEYQLANDDLRMGRTQARPETKFERRGLRLGHGVWDLVYSKQ